MKLLKIGRADSNDIVLRSKNVSSYHAEILIHDDGKIILTDKNSTNGTFVGKTKLDPNQDTVIRRGDLVKFADEELRWALVPQAVKYDDCSQVLHIGSMYSNDIVLDSSFVSRIHATALKRKGKVFIKDEDSKNGTTVNGIKIPANKEVRLKKSDRVTCGDTDVTEQLKVLFPSNAWVAVLGAVAGIAAVAAVAYMFIMGGPVKPEKLRPAVAYVNACYHYVASIEDNPMPEVFDLSFDLEAKPYQATAFFIDRDGRLATNRHVAEPWAETYRSKSEINHITQEVHELINAQLPSMSVNSLSSYNRLINTSLGQSISRYADMQMQAGGYTSISKYYSIINSIIDRLRTSPVKISGEMDYLYIGYPGRYYTHQDEMDRCSVVAVSESADKDVALIQLNSKKTPDSIKKLFNVNKFNEKELVPLKDRLYTIGYPNGIDWALDHQNLSLEPEIRETLCGKMPSKYSFEIQNENIAGASGSPIFDKKGRLVGVVWGGYVDGATFGLACQSKYVRALYDSVVSPK